MTDANEAVTEARVKLKQLAARMLVSKESLAAEVTKLERDRAEVAAMDGGEAAAVLAELDQKLEARRGELSTVEQNYQQTIAEMASLEQAGKGLERAGLRAVIDRAGSSDPFERSPVERALDNVRAHAEELEARVALDRELAGESSDAPKVPEETAEARARRELAELKAQRDKKDSSGSGSEGSGSEGSGSGGGGRGPKRTM